MAIPAHLLAHLPYFAAVARLNSFTLAADFLHVSPSAISYQIRQLEEKLKVSLVLRQSGSKVYLTSAGQQLAQDYQAFEQPLEQALTRLQPSTLTGLLKITAPVDFASQVMPYVLAELKLLAPQLTVHLDVSDTVRDIVQEGFDLAIRSAPSDERLQHIVFAKATKSVVASPEYLARYGMPTSLQDLSIHTLLIRGLNQTLSWEQLLALDDLTWSMAFNTLVLGNSFALAQGAKAGLGLALLVDFAMMDLVERGELVRVLTDYTEQLSTTVYLGFVPTPQAQVYVQVLQKALEQVLSKRFKDAFVSI